MNEDFSRICRVFNVPGQLISVRELKNGNVNHTYKLICRTVDDEDQAYILQNVNTYAFRHPVEIMNNIDLVTRHIERKKQGQVALSFCHTHSGAPYLSDASGFWRMYRFLEADTFNSCDDLDIVRSAGAAFGEFQSLLDDLDVSQVFDTTPGFHDTRKRYEKLIADMQADPYDRVKKVEPELAYLLKMQDLACQITDAYQNGDLPLRIVHNDTKINNVLFRKGSHDALAVIDLDTIMPGLAAHDFGDAIRSAANTVAEDCPDVDKVDVDMAVFTAFADGFLSQTASLFTEREIDALAVSGFVLACELSTRFLDDYIIGDPYFHTDYPGHNLVRTRCQIALSKVLWNKRQEMDSIIRSCIAKYRT